jgi:hypothetical protein
MSKILVTITMILYMSFTLLPIVWSQSNEGARRPLDLPSGGSGDDDDDEDAPETINFWGGAYEGDAFFWCLDKSCSMGWNGEIQQLKEEFTSTISSLSSQAEFGVVAFSDGHISWRASPVKANTANKGSATAWVLALNAAGWTCLGPAGVETLNIANQSQKQFKQIMILSDGEPYCNGSNTATQSLQDITMANWQQIPINTIYIATDNGGIVFMQQLATQNNGTFFNPL